MTFNGLLCRVGFWILQNPCAELGYKLVVSGEVDNLFDLLGSSWYIIGNGGKFSFFVDFTSAVLHLFKNFLKP